MIEIKKDPSFDGLRQALGGGGKEYIPQEFNGMNEFTPFKANVPFDMSHSVGVRLADESVDGGVNIDAIADALVKRLKYLGYA